MAVIIPGWVHNPGAHCASTAISGVMNFIGHPLSEAMCFGLGCGLGFAYFEHPAMTPTRMTATRSRVLEPRFFDTVGEPFAFISEKDRARSLESAKQFIRENIPLLLRADIAHLPYYNSKTHFPPHIITLWGYDDEKGAALISDTGYEGLQQVPYPDFEAARYGGNAYIQNSAEHFPVRGPRSLPDLPAAVRRALVQQAKDLSGLSLEIPALFGFEGMRKAALAMPRWAEAKDGQWCARWFYQVIEKRGTGGGAFRLLYSHFLEEAAALDPALADIAPAPEMAAIAALWTNLSSAMKNISDREDPHGLDDASALLAGIAEREERFFKNVVEMPPS